MISMVHMVVLFIAAVFICATSAIAIPSTVGLAFNRIQRGSQDMVPLFRESHEIKKRKPATYKEFKLVERANGDFGRIFSMAIAWPLSPWYFAYAYFVTPLMTKSAWAWKGWPSSFDSESDLLLRWDIQNQRALDMFAKGLTLLNAGSNKDVSVAQSKAATISKVQDMLEAHGIWDVVDLADDWIYVDTKPTKSGSTPKAKVGQIPAILVKEFLRAFGSEGVPNIHIVNQLNRNELTKMVQNIKNSDDFLETIDTHKMSSRELEEACRERFIPVTHRSDSERRRDLNSWLDVACTEQDSVVGKFSNEQNRRLVLLGHFVAKDFKTASKSKLYRAALQK